MTDLLTVPCFRRSAYEKWYSPSCAQAAACLGIHLKKIEISSDAVRMEQALPAWGRLLSACLSHSATTSSLPPHALCPCVLEREQQRGCLIGRRSEVLGCLWMCKAER